MKSVVNKLIMNKDMSGVKEKLVERFVAINEFAYQAIKGTICTGVEVSEPNSHTDCNKHIDFKIINSYGSVGYFTYDVKTIEKNHSFKVKNNDMNFTISKQDLNDYDDVLLNYVIFCDYIEDVSTGQPSVALNHYYAIDVNNLKKMIKTSIGVVDCGTYYLISKAALDADPDVERHEWIIAPFA